MANTYSPVDDLDDLRRDLSAVNENIASTALDDLDHDQDGDLDELDLKTANIGSKTCLLYTSPSPRDQRGSRMPSSA